MIRICFSILFLVASIGLLPVYFATKNENLIPIGATLALLSFLLSILALIKDPK